MASKAFTFLDIPLVIDNLAGMNRNDYSTVAIVPFDSGVAAGLAILLRNDDNLRREIRFDQSPEAETFLASTLAWADTTGSRVFGILAGSTVVGMISLSHIEQEAKKARIGYWTGTKFRGLGITRQAFALVLEVARNLGLEEVSCRIPRNNPASLAVWKRYTEDLREDGSFLKPVIHFHNFPHNMI